MVRIRKLKSSSAQPQNDGLAFAADSGGHRGASKPVQDVLVEALRVLDRDAAQAATSEKDWFRRYPAHVKRLVQASLERGPADTLASARTGIASLHDRLRILRDTHEYRISDLPTLKRRNAFRTETLTGDGKQAPQQLQVPYRDEMISGDKLLRQLERWQIQGIIEPSHAHAVREVISHPDWLDLSDQTFVLLGASAEVGPLAALAGWRAKIVAVDLPAERPWKRIERLISRGNARVLAPARDQPHSLGANLLTDLPELLDWLSVQQGPITVGCHAYLDGARHVLVAAAMDLVVDTLAQSRSDLNYAALATPSDVYAVPREAVMASERNWRARGLGERAWQLPMSLLSGGRLFRPNYPEAPRSAIALGGDRTTAVEHRYGVCDCLVTQQGPSYALAKRLQQWRAICARADGIRSSINVTPSTTTRSVIRSRALEAAFGGARYFGVEGFDPATTSALMAALLVYDLRSEMSAANPKLPLDHPLELLMQGANHGGMWRMPMAARSALPFAALIGFVLGNRSST